ncbi:hypothetical protein HBI12_113530 [Parastagonospora nodorum]|nr:hypothetical protein HBI12_113530 [Parastagonospora nodorum]KAH5424984.1 hypothetical protein HBI47_124310 [Parastagonospora nodorum]
MPLKIIIIGAGLGGLATAIALSRRGHDIEIFEKSSFHNEVGAAIHLAPNATRVLRAWDCDFEAMKPVQCDHLATWDQDEEYAWGAITENIQTHLSIDDPWLLVHRVDLHNALREKAEKGFGGKKPKIHLSCAVDSVDPSTGRVTLADGRVFQSDLIIGADGVHARNPPFFHISSPNTFQSLTAEAVTGAPTEKKSTGQSCFRFIVPISDLQSNPVTKPLLDRIGLRSINAFTSTTSSLRRLIIYPCRSGTLLNGIVFYPSNDSLDESSWLNSGSEEDLQAQVASYSPALRALCSMARDVKQWSLASRDPAPKFYKEKLVLVGDAAHPILPHQGQGGAQAFEDAAALGTLLTADVRPEDIERRLQLYMDVRYKRAVTVLFMSRVGYEHREATMEDLKRFVPDAEMPENMLYYAWASCPGRDAESKLRQEAM